MRQGYIFRFDNLYSKSNKNKGILQYLASFYPVNQPKISVKIDPATPLDKDQSEIITENRREK